VVVCWPDQVKTLAQHEQRHLSSAKQHAKQALISFRCHDGNSKQRSSSENINLAVMPRATRKRGPPRQLVAQEAGYPSDFAVGGPVEGCSTSTRSKLRRYLRDINPLLVLFRNVTCEW